MVCSRRILQVAKTRWGFILFYLLGLGVWGLLEVVLLPHWFVTIVYVDRSSPPWSVGIGYAFWSVEFTLGRFSCESWVLLEDWSGASRRCTDFGSIVGF